MEKSLMEKLIEAKKDRGIAYVNFFNNGEVRRDEYAYFRRMSQIAFDASTEDIEKIFLSATNHFAGDCDFDTINMGLLMGLVYNNDDVLENDVIKENAKPYNDIVRFYTMGVNCYLDGEQTNKIDYSKITYGRQGYLSYSRFLDYVRKANLDFDGPKSFNEFKEAILSNEPFDINLSANLNKKVEKRLIRRC